DPASRNGAANRRPIQHARQNHIVDVLRSAGYLVAALFSWNRYADNGFVIHSRNLWYPQFLAHTGRARPLFCGAASVCQNASVGQRRNFQKDPIYTCAQSRIREASRNMQPEGTPENSPSAKTSLPRR